MAGDKTDADFAELIAAGFPVGKGKGGSDGVDRTADWSSLSDTLASSGVPDGLTQTADWSGMDAGFPRGGSGVPDGLTRTADWSGMDAGFPASAGVPDGVDKTADWTGFETAPRPASVPSTPDRTADWEGPRRATVATALETARTAKAVSRTLDFEDLPSVGSPTSGVPRGSGAPSGSNRTQDWTDMRSLADIPGGSGAPAGSSKTQDWTGMGDFPTGSRAPAGSNKTQDWTGMEDIPTGSGAPKGTKTTSRAATSPLPQAALLTQEKTDEEIAAEANWDWDFLND